MLLKMKKEKKIIDAFCPRNGSGISPFSAGAEDENNQHQEAKNPAIHSLLEVKQRNTSNKEHSQYYYFLRRRKGIIQPSRAESCHYDHG